MFNRAGSRLPAGTASCHSFAYLTGMRVGEIFELTWNKVELTKRVIKLVAEDTRLASPGLSFFANGLMIY